MRRREREAAVGRQRVAEEETARGARERGSEKDQKEKKKKTDYFWYVCREERAAMHHAHVLCAAHL